LEWQFNELDKLRILPDEWQEITNEHSRLSHAASLIEGAQFALHVISESEDPLLTQLASVTQKLAKLSEFDDGLTAVMETLEPARIHLQEATSFLNDYVSRVELDPDRLRIVEQRVEILHSSARKFHVKPEQLPELMKNLKVELAQLGEATDLDSLLEQEQAARQHYMAAASMLTTARKAAAEILAVAVTAAMQELSMTGGSFSVALNPIEPSSYGLEQCEFMVAGHAGVAPRPLAKVASGGELSRLALAISVITSASTATPTLIFDEVDSGIGGGIAEVVGRLLKRLGQDYQVLCVTHLPQVASQADHHFQVSKSSQADSTISHITVLDYKARIEEIARMLGGLEITATTRKHAKELLA
jgi:DNA repair protein RecN (Recombination protein N)